MSGKEAKFERQPWISCLRIAATLAVIWLHTNGTIYGNQELFVLTDDQIKWFTVNFHLMKWSVPIFLMITGALLLHPSKRISIHECIDKYAKRQLFAVLLFGTFYAAIIEIISNRTDGLIFFRSIWGSITGNTASHLWYCFLLIGIYLILPVLKAFIYKAHKQEILYILIVLFVFDFMIPFINLLWEGDKIKFNIPFTYALFYLICGYYLTQLDTKLWIHSVVVGMPAMIVVLLTYFKTELASKCFEYNSPVIAVFAVSLFGLFQKTVNVKNKDALWRIDRLCFGVYLIHPLFIQAFYRVFDFTPMKFSVYQMGTISIWGIVCILSFGASWIANKMPGIKKIVG